MTDAEFMAWKHALMALDRYEDADDVKVFIAMVRAVRDRLDARVIDVLLSTFTDQDDYGVQQAVEFVLDSADPALFADRLAAGFPDLQRREGAMEWSLLLPGRIINSRDQVRIWALVDAADRQEGSLGRYLRSEGFLDEYPELRPYLDSYPEHR